MTRTEAAHTNGPLSHGPTSSEGKARSSQNARKHGLSAAQVVVPGENQDDFNDLYQSIESDYLPATAREDDLVSEIAASRWRMRRLVVMERAVIQIEMENVQNDKDHPCTDSDSAAAKAWAAIAVCPGMKQIHRHETRLRRSCEKAEKELDLIQGDRIRFENFVEQQEDRLRADAGRLRELEVWNREYEARNSAGTSAAPRKPKSTAGSPAPAAVQNEPVTHPPAAASLAAADTSPSLKKAA